MQPTTPRTPDPRREADDLAQRLSGLLDLDVLSARAAVEVQRRLTDHLVCVTWVDEDRPGTADEGSPWLVVGAARGHRDRDLAGLQIPPGAGIGGLVATRSRVVSVGDYRAESATRDFAGLMVGREGIGGAAGVPLWSDDRLCGVLFAGRRGDGELAERTIDLLVEVSGYLGEMIGRARQVRRLVSLARSDERNRVATALHDDVTQLLFAVGVSARRARRAIGDASPGADDELRRIEALTSSAATAVRAALRAAAPIPAEQCLALALQAEVDRCAELTGLRAELVVLDPVPEQRADVAEVAAHAVRVALANVVRHAPGASAVVTLACDDRVLTVLVQDDGPGPPPDFVLRPLRDHAGTRFGLANLARRAGLLGGTLSLRGTDEGTALGLTLPRCDGADG